jgi:drug/metabolite transporter (DMT)-like permease
VQPIINNSRPTDLDPLFFSWMTVVWELICILPLYLLEQRKRTISTQSLPRIDRPRNHWKRLVFVGATFSVSVYLMIVGYDMTGPITGMIIVKTSPFFAMVIGALYLHERITLSQFGFTVILLGGVYVLATKGTFQIEVFSLGVGLLLIVAFLWNVAHAATKPLLETHAITTPETIVVRMIVCSGFLGVFCLITRGTQDFWQWTSPAHVWSMFLMGAVYALLHFTWYKLITTVNLSIATAIMVASPIVTMVAAFLTASDVLQWYHVASLVMSFVGLYGIIVRQKRNQPKSKQIPPSNTP